MAGPLTTRPGANRRTVGRLRHRVTIQRLDESARNTAGTPVRIWVDVATVWASVEPVSARELFTTGQVQAEATHRVILRHRPDVTAKSRLVWVTSRPANQVLNVASAGPAVEVANSLELVCVHEQTGPAGGA